MKKYLLLLSVIIIGLSGCNKDQTTAQAAVDDKKIQAYLSANNLSMTKDANGIYYKIITTGPSTTAADFPTTASTIKVTYTGKYLDGVVFDSANGTELLLSGAVLGFQYAMPHINTGGRITFIIPSALAYGTAGSGSVPANAILVFTLDLLSFHN